MKDSQLSSKHDPEAYAYSLTAFSITSEKDVRADVQPPVEAVTTSDVATTRSEHPTSASEESEVSSVDSVPSEEDEPTSDTLTGKSSSKRKGSRTKR